MNQPLGHRESLLPERHRNGRTAVHREVITTIRTRERSAAIGLGVDRNGDASQRLAVARSNHAAHDRNFARLEGRLTVLSTASPLNWMRWIPVAIVAVIVVVALLLGARIVLVPLLSSVALAYLMAPVASWFERRGWSRSTASMP